MKIGIYSLYFILYNFIISIRGREIRNHKLVTAFHTLTWISYFYLAPVEIIFKIYLYLSPQQAALEKPVVKILDFNKTPGNIHIFLQNLKKWL